jgi:hypothetical protein
MSGADEQVQCPHCGATFRGRDLHATTVVVSKCRACNGTITLEEQWASKDEEAMLREDVDTVNAWLDTVAQADGLQVQPVREREAVGEFLWSIQGLPFPWRCEAVYDKSRPDVVIVRLRTEPKAAEPPEGGVLSAACASRGVQPVGMRSGGTSGLSSWWGAEQVLLTGWLRPDLFRPVVNRLDEVLREVASRLPLD